jgi:Lon protease-like protein
MRINDVASPLPACCLAGGFAKNPGQWISVYSTADRGPNVSKQTSFLAKACRPPPMEIISVFPLSSGLFPDGCLDLQIFEVRYLDLVRRCHREQTAFGVVSIQEGKEVMVPGQTPALFSHGTMAHIETLDTVQAALLRIRCRGGRRFQLHRTYPGPLGVWQAEVDFLPADSAVEIPVELNYLALRLGQGIAQAQKEGRLPELPLLAPFRLDECGWVADRWAELLNLSASAKVDLLREADPLERLRAIDRTIGGPQGI